MSYSQHGQDEWVLEIFERCQKFCDASHPLKFVEAGAGNGIDLSNTKLLEELGWRGLLIEPHPEAFEKLKANRQEAVCVKTLLWHENESRLAFLRRRGWKSRIVDEPTITNPPESRRVHREMQRARSDGQMLKLRTRTLEDVLTKEYIKHFDNEIHYMSLDLEGAEWEVMRVFPLNHFRPWVIGIERPGWDLTNLLHDFGYIECKYLGEDTMFVREDMLKELGAKP